MIRPKVDLIELLKEHGYTTYVIYKQKLFGQGELQKIRKGGLPSWAVLNKICTITNKQPGELLEFLPDDVEQINLE